MPIGYSAEGARVITGDASTTVYQIPNFEITDSADIFMWRATDVGGPKQELTLDAGVNGFSIDFPLSTKHPRITLTEPIGTGWHLEVYRAVKGEQTYAPKGAIRTLDTEIFDRLDRVATSNQDVHIRDLMEYWGQGSKIGPGTDSAPGGANTPLFGGIGGQNPDLWIGHTLIHYGMLNLQCSGDGSGAYLDAEVRLYFGSNRDTTDPIVGRARVNSMLLAPPAVTEVNLPWRFTWERGAAQEQGYVITLNNLSRNAANTAYLDITIPSNRSNWMLREKLKGFA